VHARRTVRADRSRQGRAVRNAAGLQPGGQVRSAHALSFRCAPAAPCGRRPAGLVVGFACCSARAAKVCAARVCALSAILCGAGRRCCPRTRQTCGAFPTLSLSTGRRPAAEARVLLQVVRGSRDRLAGGLLVAPQSITTAVLCVSTPTLALNNAWQGRGVVAGR